MREGKESLEKTKAALIDQKEKLITDKQSLSQENSRLKQDLQRALDSMKAKPKTPDNKNVVSQEDRKADGDDTLNDKEPLPVADAVQSNLKTLDNPHKILLLPEEKKDINEDDSLTNKLKVGEDKTLVVGDEISGKAAASDDKLNLIVDAAEEAKRRDPSA